MNKGLIQSHLNRAIAKGDTEKIAKYQGLLGATVTVPQKPISNSIEVANARLIKIEQMKKVQFAYFMLDKVMYVRKSLEKFETLDLSKCTFFARFYNGTSQQIFF